MAKSLDHICLLVKDIDKAIEHYATILGETAPDVARQRPEKQERLKQALSHLLNVPFRFDSLGSQIIYYREGV